MKTTPLARATRVLDIENFDGYTLDIGSGTNPRGNVNIDLYTGKSPHILGDENIKIKGYFIRADGRMLPFRDNSFDLVNASQVMEHVIDPPRLVREMRRVSRKWVTIEVPNHKRVGVEANPMHLYSWGPRTLRNFLRQFFAEVEIVGIPLDFGDSTLMRFLEGLIIKLFGPSQIKAVCGK